MLYSDGNHIISILSIEHLHREMYKLNIGRNYYNSGDMRYYNIPKKRRKSFLKKYTYIKKVDVNNLLLLYRKYYSSSSNRSGST